ncbi:adenylylsulfate kinase [Robbsia andropogonis]|uniref:Adenylyl-sulfate kinase n=1 Tax=Robbsia andropogonis TaxID=28092 RepID=A0A0F5JWN3_9BURK|nr:adenylyl-sulfate kinase [Robbsia andropogonis]KKB61667.1 adenylylsulfate kinase [Robbsia andropogonis]
MEHHLAAIRHIKLASGYVSLRDRAALLSQEPLTVWLTGLPASGKSTIAYALERELVMLGHACYVLDGDNVRHRLNRDLGFSDDDRNENIRRVSEVAALMNDAGLIVITSLISPRLADREMARVIIGEDRFVEVYVSTSLDVCESRDPKGLYAKARSGKIPAFTGVSAPYEAPLAADIVLDTAHTPVKVCVSRLASLVWSKFDNQRG